MNRRCGKLQLSCRSLQTLPRNLNMVLEITGQETSPEFPSSVAIAVRPPDCRGVRLRGRPAASPGSSGMEGKASSPPSFVNTFCISEIQTRDLETHRDVAATSNPEQSGVRLKEGYSQIGTDAESPPAAPVTNILRYPRDLLAYLSSGSGTRKRFTKNKHAKGVTSACDSSSELRPFIVLGLNRAPCWHLLLGQLLALLPPRQAALR